MPGSSSDDITDSLIQYVDNEMATDEREAFEKLLQQDAVLYERYQLMLAARSAIRSKGLKERVSKIQEEYLRQRDETPVKISGVPKTAGKYSFFRTFMRVAAAFAAIVTGYAVFQYGTTNKDSVYESSFINYQLPVVRGEEQLPVIDSLYDAKKYNAVITAFDSDTQKDRKDYFLAGQSYLHLNKPAEAVSAFQQIEKMNALPGDKYFVQETDFYLALAYLKAGMIDEAEKQLNMITSNKQHLFYDKAKDISKLKLAILKLKK